MPSSDRMQTRPRLQGSIVFLTGFMASGKTHFGRRLAEVLSVPFRDLDEVLEHEQGKSISSIFRDDGEEFFRILEREALERLVASIRASGSGTGAVVATGGGAACHDDNMAWMNGQGVTVWLNPPFAVLLARLSSETVKRPLVSGLTGDVLEAAVRQRLDTREPYYRMAQIHIPEADPDPAHWLT
ncbi:MAG: shikimate kinase [Chitinophagia bacterium]|nr:shikimate kinase [Chitinophagia bacterium]